MPQESTTIALMLEIVRINAYGEEIWHTVETSESADIPLKGPRGRPNYVFHLLPKSGLIHSGALRKFIDVSASNPLTVDHYDALNPRVSDFIHSDQTITYSWRISRKSLGNWPRNLPAGFRVTLHAITLLLIDKP